RRDRQAGSGSGTGPRRVHTAPRRHTQAPQGDGAAGGRRTRHGRDREEGRVRGGGGGGSRGAPGGGSGGAEAHDGGRVRAGGPRPKARVPGGNRAEPRDARGAGVPVPRGDRQRAGDDPVQDRLRRDAVQRRHAAQGRGGTNGDRPPRPVRGHRGGRRHQRGHRPALHRGRRDRPRGGVVDLQGRRHHRRGQAAGRGSERGVVSARDDFG